MKNKKSSPLQMRAAALAVASCLTVTPWVAEAASLGKITVLSALGQPLRAEIELAASREELTGMTAKLASRDTAQQAGVDLLPVVSDLRFVIDRRGGAAIVKVTSSKPVNEPFLDFFIELNWPAGRLVREYVFLLDPPEAAARATIKPVSPVEARPAVAESKPTVKPIAVERAAKPEKTEAAESEKAEKVESKPVEKAAEKAPEKIANDRREVKRGETLNKIANQLKPEGISLEQMLVGLYKGNPDAFLGGNINRLRTGVVLNVPDRDAAAGVTPEEARKVLKTQVSDWNAYRHKLASAVAKTPVAKEEAATQTASGKIKPKVEEKAATEAPKDKVKVSKGEAGGKPAGKNAAEEALVAKEKALKEANERLSMLEKNVSDLQKLVEMKNQSLAEAQKQAAAAKLAAEQRKQEETKMAAKAPEAVKPPAAPVAKAPEPAKPAETPKPAEAAKPVETAKPTEAAKPADVAKPAEGAPVEPPKVAEATKAAEAVPPKPAPKKVVIPPPPEPEEGLFDNPLLLAGGGGVLALLGGLFFYRRRRAQAVENGNASTLPLDSETGPNSVFRNTGGQSVDTGNTTPPSTDFSQTGPGTIDTDEVDPVAEADVYMAYGRDAQAEEILLEALQKDPQRTAIHVKLLEIYANRKSNRQFETLASELYAQTGGVGAEWEKVAAMGAKLDPANPLYTGSQAVGDKADFDAAATLVVSPETMTTLATPSESAPIAEPAAPEAMELPAASEAAPLASLDFDLGGAVEPAAPAVETAAAQPAALDFDFSVEAAPAPAVEPAPAGEDVNTLDFDLGFGGEVAPAEMPAQLAAAEPVVDFSFDLPETAAQPEAVPAAMAETVIMPEAPEAEPLAETEVAAPALDFAMELGEPAAVPEPVVDLSAINLDLGAPAESPAEPVPAPVAAQVDPRWDEVNTKLDLAKAYEEMGDLEGARELLQEVLSEGSPDLVEQAKAILERVGE